MAGIGERMAADFLRFDADGHLIDAGNLPDAATLERLRVQGEVWRKRLPQTVGVAPRPLHYRRRPKDETA